MIFSLKFPSLFKKKFGTSSRKSRKSHKRFFIYGKILMFSILSLYGLLAYKSKLPRFVDLKLQEYYIELTKKLGLTIENVYLEGQNHTDLNLIIDNLGIKTGQPILSVSVHELRDKLEKITWIKHAIVERNFPSTIFIGIIEKTPIALWQKDNKFYLIDESGDVISENNLEKFSNYMVVIGNNAPRYAKSFIKLVSKNSKLYENISHATRVGDRRWNIKFHNGVEVKLPEENMDSAWNYVEDLYNKQNLFGQAVSMIDLRIPNKIYIK